MGLTETTLAYYAGLFDGEGCVIIKHVKYAPRRQSEVAKKWRSFQMELSINLVNPLVLIELHKQFGGQFRRDKKIKVHARRHMYYWRLSANEAVAFLLAIRPYVWMKKDQVEIALTFQERVINKVGKLPATEWKRLGYSISDDELAVRLSMMHQLQELKWVEYPEAMNGIPAKSGNPAMGIPSQAERLLSSRACVETMGRRQSLN